MRHTLNALLPEREGFLSSATDEKKKWRNWNDRRGSNKNEMNNGRYPTVSDG